MIIRCLLTPVYILVGIIRLAVDIISRLSGWIFGALAGLLLLVTLLCYFFGLEDGAEIRHMLIGCGILFLIPQIAAVLSAMLEGLTEIIGDHIR